MHKQPNPQTVAARLKKLSPLRPALGIVLGSGFQHTLSQMRVEAEIPYAKLPGFAPVSVAGPAGKLLIGHVGETPVAALSGRAHFYEGHPMEVVTFPVRVLAEFGIRDLLLTNAAGGINRKFQPGDFMQLSDHINFMGVNPLRGELPPNRKRFIDLTHAYDRNLNQLVQQAAKLVRCRLHCGVYVAVPGPCYETPAEIRAFARLGGDAVGMSTVPEAVVARQCGLAVTGLSCITNLAAGRSKESISHEEVLAVGKQFKEQAAQVIVEFVKLYAKRK